LNKLGGEWAQWDQGSAFDINDSGQIVGYFSLHNAFLYSDGIVDIFVPRSHSWPWTDGYSDNWASGINNAGQVVGHMVSNFYGNGETRNFLYEGNQFTDLGTTESTGYGFYPDIDESGQIVPYHIGSYTGPSNLIDLLEYNPGWISLTSYAINSSGWIVGQGWYDVGPYPPDYMMQAFLARPVPEPSTMLLLGSGLFVFLKFRKKFKK